MLITLIRYWQPLSAALVTAALAFLLHTVSINAQERSHEHELAQQQSQLIKRCGEVQEAARDASAGHQARLNRLSSDLANARRMLNGACVRVRKGDTASGHNAATGQPVNGGQDARVAAASLLDYAEEAERYRSQLIACQELLNERQ